MAVNGCCTCSSLAGSIGSGVIPDPSKKWWQFGKTIICPDCGGDGYEKPTGWPDREEMKANRPSPPTIPPRAKEFTLKDLNELFLEVEFQLSTLNPDSWPSTNGAQRIIDILDGDIKIVNGGDVGSVCFYIHLLVIKKIAEMHIEEKTN